jgi:peptidyl-prolyl cis-trans isomerase B (cyclophilin B)
MGIGRGRGLALFTLVALVAMALAAAVALGGTVPVVSMPTKPSGCEKVGATTSHDSEHLKAPPQTVKRTDHLVAVVKTNCGRFEIALDARRSPRVVNSFVYLARSGFYDGLLFYRVVPDFVIQGGDPRNNGTGGPGYTVTEAPPHGFHYSLGTAAMAKTLTDPPGTSGSNFFVVSGPQGRLLPPEYAEFGKVHVGLGTVKRIGALGTRDETPTQVVRIASITIKQRG